jgi:hypothetical protein
MKTLAYILAGSIALSSIVSCNNSSSSSSTTAEGEQQVQSIQNELDERAVMDSTVRAMAKTKVTVDSEEFDFGEVIEGEKVTHTYVLKNEGDQPFLISNIFTPCGCTVPSYSKKPILPGETTNIDVEFNTANKPGLQSKSLDITSNAEPAIKLSFKAQVKPKK